MSTLDEKDNNSKAKDHLISSSCHPASEKSLTTSSSSSFKTKPSSQQSRRVFDQYGIEVKSPALIPLIDNAAYLPSYYESIDQVVKLCNLVVKTREVCLSKFVNGRQVADKSTRQKKITGTSPPPTKIQAVTTHGVQSKEQTIQTAIKDQDNVVKSLDGDGLMNRNICNYKDIPEKLPALNVGNRVIVTCGCLVNAVGVIEKLYTDNDFALIRFEPHFRVNPNDNVKNYLKRFVKVVKEGEKLYEIRTETVQEY